MLKHVWGEWGGRGDHKTRMFFLKGVFSKRARGERIPKKSKIEKGKMLTITPKKRDNGRRDIAQDSGEGKEKGIRGKKTWRTGDRSQQKKNGGGGGEKRGGGTQSGAK